MQYKTFKDLIQSKQSKETLKTKNLDESEIKFEALAVMKEIHSALADLSFVEVIAKMREENPLKKNVTTLEKELNDLTTKVGQFVTDNLSDAVDMEQADIEDAEVEKEEQKELEIKKSEAAAKAIAGGKGSEKEKEEGK